MAKQSKITFAFLVHPITLNYVYFFLGKLSPFFKIIPAYTLKRFLKYAPIIKYVRVNKIMSSLGNCINGIILVCPLLPEQFVTLEKSLVLKKIIRGGEIAQSMGAKIIGLGGFTSIVSNQGEDVVKELDIAVTTGNTYTASLVTEGIHKAVELLQRDLSKSTMAIIGATGDIGSVCARIFVEEVNNLFLVARDQNRLQEFALSLGKHHGSKVKTFTAPEDAAYSSDIILTSTSATTTVLDYRRIKKGTIVCDVSVPPNIAREASKCRNDILVFEGGYAVMPYFENIKTHKFKKHFQHGAIFGCLAETILLALENRFENFSMGRGKIGIDRVKLIAGIGLKHGFKLAPFFSGDKVYTEKEIEMLKLSLRE